MEKAMELKMLHEPLNPVQQEKYNRMNVNDSFEEELYYEEDVKMMARCIQLDMECAAICYASAQLMSLGSDKAKEICRICADICEACAAECEKHAQHGMDHCRECAEACRKCAEECRKMAA